MEKQFDVVDFIMAFEGGSASDTEIIRGMQHLINDGSAWTLQGFYGRMATSLIEQGYCKHKGEWTPEDAVNEFLESL